MTNRQLTFAVFIILAASCGGGGGEPAALAAPSATAPSWTTLAFNVDGTAPDTAGGVAPIQVNAGPFTVTWQVQSAAEAYRVRLYFSADDILDGRSNSSAGGDSIFYDVTCAAGACANPRSASCAFTSPSGYRMECSGDSAHGGDPSQAGFSSTSLPWPGFIIVRVCSVAEPGHCDAWPAPVELQN